MGTKSYTTPGAATFRVGTDCPSGVTVVDIEYWQAGAGGAGGNPINNGGGGGGSYGKIVGFSVANNDILSLIIPAGGTSNNVAENGQVTDVGSNIIFVDASTADAGSSGVGGSSGSIISDFPLDIENAGGSGDDAAGITSGGGGGSGASSVGNGVSATNATGATAPAGGGNGGNGGAALANGSNGTSPGGGGGGAGDGAATGGTGGNGKVLFTWLAAAPVITSNGGGATASISIVEGNTAVTTVTADGDATIAFTITGGADQAKFSLNSSTGALAFLSAPNYEVITDADNNHIYEVEVTATNTAGSDMQAISVTAANDVADDPAPIPINELSIGTGIGL